MKGFDIYLQLDELLAKSDFARHFAYTYIGNLPPAVRFRHVRHVAPLSGTPLADELRRHHVYLTASIHEPAGMHHIEAALCGLPLLYRRSGALPEYCDGFGVGFDQETFEGKLFELRDRYWKFRPIMTSYSYDASRMCRGYIDLFRDLMSRRDEILARRSWGRAASIQMQWTASAYQACYTLLQRWKHSR